MASLAELAIMSTTLLSIISTSALPVCSYQFRVGGERGWVQPTGHETETYNEWAIRNRFHIGDSIYFRYQNDSVTEVSKKAYTNCNATDPISEHEDGNTIFQFGRYGCFYFISGEPSHCESGQKLIIRVMVHPAVQSPESAAILNQKSTTKQAMASYFLLGATVMLVILYLAFVITRT